MFPNQEPFLTFDVRNAITTHMIEEGDKEACGWITLSNKGYVYHPRENKAKDPEHFFQFSKRDSTMISTREDIVAFVHTHPHGPLSPSKKDMEIQISVGKPSVICARDQMGVIDIFSFGDHILDVPLDGRPFRTLVTDCYEAIRAYYWQKHQTKLKAFPREDAWWSTSAVNMPLEERDLYSRFFNEMGFDEFTPDLGNPNSRNHPRPGDGILMKLGPTIGDVVNHAAVYIGNNLIYHHRVAKLSGVTPLGYCLNTGMVRKWVRNRDFII